jgi:hypothetical protein
MGFSSDAQVYEEMDANSKGKTSTYWGECIKGA